MYIAVNDVLKTIVAAGLLAGASSAFAQSSVQLYGQVDEWVGSQKFPGNKASAQVADVGMSTSYWALKGAEDMGNGYKAIFTLEDFFEAQNGSLWGDPYAYVGIESPYGTVAAGRLTADLLVSTLLFNPFIDSFVFSPMEAHVYLGLGTFPTYSTDQGVTGSTGWNNAVKYSTPNFGGLSASVMYGLGNTAGQNSAKKWSGQVLYFHGPFAATVIYQYVNFNSVPLDLGSFSTSGVPGLKSQSVVQLGASYDMKFVKFFAQYMYTYNGQQITSWHVNTAQGGVSVPLGIGTVMASYAYSRDGGGFDQTRQTAAIGYDYPLSKLTDIYAAYMYDHISSQSTGDTFGVGIRAKF